MGKIKLLDDNTINQIAAGEVIENPASIIKELLENSKDAHACHITIQTSYGGRLLIRVSDDGAGMDEQDLLLAIERHATSKLSTAQELSSILTMGFRGEALASIAAVSKLQIHSSEKNQQGAYIYVQGGKVEGVYKKPRQQGTAVEVKDLFYNVSARRAFQKSIASDTAEIHKAVIRFALSNPQIGITWIHDDKTERQLQANQSLRERILSLLGDGFVQMLLPVADIGYIGMPTEHRPNRLAQYLTINNRSVVCPWISHLIQECYGTRLPIGRFPLFVLHLQLPTQWVDVNVHPQKKEVRLRELAAIADSLKKPIEKALQKTSLVVGQSAWQEVDIEPVFSIRTEQPLIYHLPAAASQAQQQMFFQTPSIVGIFSHYLLLDKQPHLQIVDLQKAAFRIRFETIDQALSSQSLLVPLPVEVSVDEKLFLQKHEEALAHNGFVIRPFGQLTFLIEAIPHWMELSDISSFIHELVEQGITQCAKLLAKRGKKLNFSLEEAKAILQQLLQYESPELAPDGSPIMALITKEELHAKFK